MRERSLLLAVAGATFDCGTDPLQVLCRHNSLVRLNGKWKMERNLRKGPINTSDDRAVLERLSRILKR